MAQRLKRMEIITVALSSRDLRQVGYGRILRSFSNANPSGGIKPADNAAFGAQPQGYGWRIDRQEHPASRRVAENACTVAVSWPPSPPGRLSSRNRGHIAS